MRNHDLVSGGFVAVTAAGPILQITLTVCANPDKVTEEARRLEREGLAKIHEYTPTLILTVPDHANEEVVIATLAGLARKVADVKEISFCNDPPVVGPFCSYKGNGRPCVRGRPKSAGSKYRCRRGGSPRV